MRTTLTLDDDVSAAIERRRREFDHTLKQEVNDLLRAGLARLEEQERTAPAARFRVEPFDTGGLLIDVTDVSAALEAAEGPWYK